MSVFQYCCVTVCRRSFWRLLTSSFSQLCPPWYSQTLSSVLRYFQVSPAAMPKCVLKFGDVPSAKKVSICFGVGAGGAGGVSFGGVFLLKSESTNPTFLLSICWTVFPRIPLLGSAISLIELKDKPLGPIGISGLVASHLSQKLCNPFPILCPMVVCLIAQKRRNQVIPIQKSIVIIQARLMSPLSKLILMNPRMPIEPSSSTFNPDTLFSISCVSFFPVVIRFFSPVPIVFLRFVIKTRERLTANDISTGANKSFCNSFNESHFGNIPPQSSPLKTRKSTIKGEVAIATQRIPILAKSTITSAHKGRINSPQKIRLIRDTMKSCHVPSSV